MKRIAGIMLGLTCLMGLLSGCAEQVCQPYCTGRQCGDDGCGGSCGTCPGNGLHCIAGACRMPQCTPSCQTRECGDDGCGGSCGTCPADFVCQNTYGKCVTSCEPMCIGRICGDDGCGGSCGQCGNGLFCYDGLCDMCRPNCAGRTCGDDGCGGSCGQCAGNTFCSAVAGQCIPYRVIGKLTLETQTAYFDASTTPALDKKTDVVGARIPISLRDKNGDEIAKTVTAYDGTFEIPMPRLPEPSDWISIVPAWNVAGKTKVAVLRVKEDDTNEFWQWTIKLANYVSNADPGNLGNVRISTNQYSGALYIYQIVVRAYEDLVKYGFANELAKLPSMAIVWTPGHVWNCGTCYIKAPYTLGKIDFDSMMYVGGSELDESAWGYPTILHEFGHYVLFQKRDNSVGGTHYLTGTSHPTLAWSEGWATFFALQMMSFRANAPVSQYWRVLNNGSYWIDFAHLYDGALSGNIAIPQPSIDKGMFQDIGEGWISYMLWDFWDGSDVKDPCIPPDGVAIPAKQFFAALSHMRYLSPQLYFKPERCPAEEPALTSCKSNAHFMHFIDALLCKSDPETVIKASDLLIERHFPYDRSPVCVMTY